MPCLPGALPVPCCWEEAPRLMFLTQNRRSMRNTKSEKKDATPGVENLTVLGHAARIAPATVPLDITEPASKIQSGFLSNNIIPLASIDDIIRFQPSVYSQNPNGPGMGKAEAMSLRGFQDGQYNMTFDGIPFGDATDLHHTTSSLFISHFLGEVQIDRGPGTGSTIGNATFGGTMGFTSKTPPAKRGCRCMGPMAVLIRGLGVSSSTVARRVLVVHFSICSMRRRTDI